MSYPFADNRYAQNSSSGHHSYNDPYDSHQQPSHFGTAAGTYPDEHEQGSYEYEPRGATRNSGPAPLPPVGEDTDSYGAYAAREHDDYMHDEKAVGRSPYETAPEMHGASLYAGKSIWTADDKRVMAKRSVPVRCFRVLFCTIINAIIVIISIVCLVVIFARPPNVGIGQIVNPSADTVGVSGAALTINGSVEFIISNPNSISATLTSLKANIYDKVDESETIGRASVSDEKIAAHSNTTINFPYQIIYDPTGDTSQAILKDLAAKCGLDGGASEELNLVLKVDAKISILSVPIPVSFDQDINFTCPLDSAIFKALGINGISSLTGGSRKRAIDRQEL